MNSMWSFITYSYRGFHFSLGVSFTGLHFREEGMTETCNKAFWNFHIVCFKHQHRLVCLFVFLLLFHGTSLAFMRLCYRRSLCPSTFLPALCWSRQYVSEKSMCHGLSIISVSPQGWLLMGDWKWQMGHEVLTSSLLFTGLLLRGGRELRNDQGS